MSDNHSKSNLLYRVLFTQNDQCYEIYARYLSDESLMGFIEVEELIFHETKTGLLVDPTEEKLRAEFKGVNRCYIPFHSVLRIDEVVKEGAARIVPFEKVVSVDAKTKTRVIPRITKNPE
ncbi:MAG: hypothetical protein A3E84_02820 [Gammaproteobacteria bacterium RIFCSPHIGHO2_12_FULL_42_13]|nr:MAG: hypothetical protein A3E84_02820 [Gammaproteobacteria bacterium RIFCSPHIGHO2_12_FULL_42_13]